MFNSTSKSGGLFSSFNFGDYEAIRNGSYLKLAKKQFARLMEAVKAMFNGEYSYANQTAEKASSVASASQRDTRIYTSQGSYASMMGSWFNTSI